MKKSRERHHVTLVPETRTDNGRTSFRLTWYPNGKRKRRTFTDEVQANQEADRIEALLRRGFASASEIPKANMATLILLCEQIPNVSPQDIVRFYLERHRNQPATVAEVGRAFIASRSSTADFSIRQIDTVKSHVDRFITQFETRAYISIDHEEYKSYLVSVIGGAGKTQNNHLITLSSMSRWARDIGTGKIKFLPPGMTAAEQVTRANEDQAEHVVYTPEQFTRLLVSAPTDMVMFLALGQLAGIRAAERSRLFWSHWRQEEGNKIVCNRDVTKTKQRRGVDVSDSMAEWLTIFRGEPDEPMVPCPYPHKATGKIAKAAGVPWIDNALRAGFASYHLELHDNAPLTAKNDGHSVKELETDYKSIEGVTKKTAAKILATTPRVVIDYARKHGLKEPEWAFKLLTPK